MARSIWWLWQCCAMMDLGIGISGKQNANIHLYSQVLWMRRLRVLRRLLVKYRAAGKIDKHLYHELYHLSKGNTFKHKRALVEHVRFPSPNTSPTPMLTYITDSQGQGRGRPRAGPQGGDGRQACEDQGCPREETGENQHQAKCAHRRGGGGRCPVNVMLSSLPRTSFMAFACSRQSLEGLMGFLARCFSWAFVLNASSSMLSYTCMVRT